MSERERQAVEIMLDHIEKIERFTAEMKTWEAFYEAEACFDATVFNLALIGEKTAKLSPDFRKKYSSVEWRSIKNFRNFIVHNYDDLDPRKVWKTLKTNLPDLKIDLQKIIAVDL